MSQHKNIKDNEQPILMKIGQLAKESDTNRSTIHHYINLGLLPPPFKERSKLHLFSNIHLTRLKLIRTLRKEKKLPLSKIKEAFDNGYLPDILPALDANENDSAKYIDFKRLPFEECYDKKALILDASVKLFSQNVFGAVRMEDIAKKAEVPKAVIYQYFSSKQELFMSCIERLRDTGIIPVAQIEEIQKETDFFKRFHKRIAAFLVNFPSFKSVLTLARMVLAHDNNTLRNNAIEAFQLIARTPLNDILEAQKKGTIRQINPEILSYILCGMADILGQRLEMDSRFNVEEVTDIYIDLIKHGLSTTAKPTTQKNIPEEFSAELVLETGSKTKVTKIRFNGKDYLLAKIADLSVRIDVHRVSVLTMCRSSPACDAKVKLKNGKELALDLDKNTIITGEMIAGSFELQIREISKVFF